LKLYLDGARLGYGLASSNTDVTMHDIAENVDVFYIGGTKVGAFFGEAVVIPNPETVKNFFTIIKLHGALLAKGWLLGIQFDTLFTNNLYYNISKHADEMAMFLKDALTKKGYKFFIDSYTNQQFIVVENEKLKKLKEKVSFSSWEKYGENNTVIRFATSWATKIEDIEELISIL
jgi:threonine aldolase